MSPTDIDKACCSMSSRMSSNRSYERRKMLRPERLKGKIADGSAPFCSLDSGRFAIQPTSVAFVGTLGAIEGFGIAQTHCGTRSPISSLFFLSSFHFFFSGFMSLSIFMGDHLRSVMDSILYCLS